MDINTVTVIGANGTMGSNVAGIFASFGSAKVYMISRTKEKSKQAIENVVKSVRADAIRENLISKDYEDLEQCVECSDLVFESVAENLEVKKDILKRISKCINSNAIICTGTSGLSINTMSKYLDERFRSRYLGMHFFNPPYNMTLCELIPTDNTNDEILNYLKRYLENVLLRTVVVVKDKPAFIGNRIGFHFINKAIQLAEEYKHKGGIDYIDAIFGSYTGRNMAPIRTADFVGLDIHKAIVNNIEKNADDFRKNDFVLPAYVEKLIQKNKLGKKVGEGLYKITVSDEGQKKYCVYDIETDKYREIKTYDFMFKKKMISYIKVGKYKEAIEFLLSSDDSEAYICKKMLVEYVLYSLNMNREVGYDIDNADDAMATGFSWIPPFALISFLGGKEKFKEVLESTLSKNEINSYMVDTVLGTIKESKYDYKKFVKAKD